MPLKFVTVNDNVFQLLGDFAPELRWGTSVPRPSLLCSSKISLKIPGIACTCRRSRRHWSVGEGLVPASSCSWWDSDWIWLRPRCQRTANTARPTPDDAHTMTALLTASEMNCTELKYQFSCVAKRNNWQISSFHFNSILLPVWLSWQRR